METVVIKMLTYEPEFRGPIRDRKCTDCWCLLIFVVFISGWAVLSFFGKFQYLIVAEKKKSYLSLMTLLCVIIDFQLCVCMHISFVLLAIRYGDPEQVIYPSDSFGRICGRNELRLVAIP